jgi:hypothetical protein
MRVIMMYFQGASASPQGLPHDAFSGQKLLFTEDYWK